MPLSKMITWLGPERQLGMLGSTAAILEYHQEGKTIRGQFHVKHGDLFYLGELKYYDSAMTGDWEHDQKIWEAALDQLCLLYTSIICGILPPLFQPGA